MSRFWIVTSVLLAITMMGARGCYLEVVEKEHEEPCVGDECELLCGRPDCAVEPMCSDLEGVFFGSCEMMMGYGVVGGECLPFSGCGAYGYEFFETQVACETKCLGVKGGFDECIPDNAGHGWCASTYGFAFFCSQNGSCAEAFMCEALECCVPGEGGDGWCSATFGDCSSCQESSSGNTSCSPTVCDGCQSQADCDDFNSCVPPKGPTVCGICQDNGPCSDDSECDDDFVCDSVGLPTECPTCGDSTCVRACTSNSDCLTGQTCADDGRCRATECASDDECPLYFRCAHQACAGCYDSCLRASCSSSDDCDGGICVNGNCFGEAGACELPVP